MAPTLDHIEKTLADAYRKEIDQEENVWRSLPFFAATLAFQFTTLAQIVLRMPQRGTGAWWDVVVVVALLAICIALALGFLVASIAPARFSYISEEPALLDYARGLDSDARQSPDIDALAELKSTLCDQYSVATRDNRRINQRRGYRRAIAGLATSASIGCTAFLVIRLIMYHVSAGC